MKASAHRAMTTYCRGGDTNRDELAVLVLCRLLRSLLADQRLVDMGNDTWKMEVEIVKISYEMFYVYAR